MNILIVTAHPYAAFQFCGGLMRCHKDLGDGVIVYSLTKGELMPVPFSAEELKDMTVKEAENAAEILGIDAYHALDIPDTQVRCDGPTVKKLAKVILAERAELIVTHGPQDTHPDCVHTCKAVLQAVFRTNLAGNSACSTKVLNFENPLTTFNFQPSLFYDVTAHMKLKVEAARQFQLSIQYENDHDEEPFLTMMTAQNRYRGLQSGCDYAEAYGSLSTYKNLI